jgi:hypothetical protein
MAENTASTGFTCLYPQLWTLKIHASLHHQHLIMVTFITQTLHHPHSLALLLSLSLIHKRLRSHGTLAIKSTNYSRLYSHVTHVTFFQTLSFSQTLLLMSLYHLLLSSSQILKQSLLKGALKGVIPGHVL